MPYRYGPPTQCPTCRWTEMSLLERLADKVYQVAIGPNFTDMVRAISIPPHTTAPAPDWYDTHRRLFEVNGAKIELDRMLRHETEIGAMAA